MFSCRNMLFTNYLQVQYVKNCTAAVQYIAVHNSIVHHSISVSSERKLLRKNANIFVSIPQTFAKMKIVLQQSKNVTEKCTENLSPPPCILYLLASINIYSVSTVQYITFQFICKQCSTVRFSIAQYTNISLQ